MSIGGGHRAHGSVVVDPWGCTDEEVLKKKRREGPGAGSGLLGPSGSLKELSAAWFCRVKLKTNK